MQTSIGPLRPLRTRIAMKAGAISAGAAIGAAIGAVIGAILQASQDKQWDALSEEERSERTRPKLLGMSPLPAVTVIVAAAGGVVGLFM
jgi:hypothetical protein